MSKKILRSDQFLLIAKFQFFISDLPKNKHFLYFSNREKNIENPIRKIKNLKFSKNNSEKKKILRIFLVFHIGFSYFHCASAHLS